MKDPMISIIIPVYNGANYLKDAIDSAIAQTYSNKEIIVVNDGSTDDEQTEKVCLEYGDKIRYFWKENSGVSAALNLGIANMRGEYFTWLAHDDYYYADKLMKQMGALQNSEDKTKIVYGNYDLLNVSLGGISFMRQEDSYSVAQLTNSVFPILAGSVHSCTLLVHKSHFDRVGLFDETLPLSQDCDLMFRMFRGQQLIFVSESLLCSRLHRQSNKMTEASGFALAHAQLYYHFLQSLTLKEIKEMFPSARALYYRIACMMRSRVHTPEVDMVLKNMLKLPEEKFEQKCKLLTVWLRECAGGNDVKICIFGAGFHGKILKYELDGRNIPVHCFCDNDPQKHKSMIAGIPCMSLSDMEEDKEKLLVIIAADVYAVILEQLAEAGFPHVITKQSIDNLLLTCPPQIL